MRRIVLFALFFCCASALFAQETPRLAVMELTDDGTFTAEQREQLTKELRQLIANERRFRVLDGPPQRKRLAALGGNTRSFDHRACMESGCLAQLQTALTIDAVLWANISCNDDTRCFLQATLHPVKDGAPTKVLIETPSTAESLRGALLSIARKLGLPAPTITFAVEHEQNARRGNDLPEMTLHRPRQRHLKPEARQRLFTQNYIFTLQGFVGTTIGAKLTLGTLRWENFQMEIAHVAAGAQTIEEISNSLHITSYMVGLGGKWAVSSNGEHELGFMIGALGAGFTFTNEDTRLELLPTKLMYRNNMDNGGVFEVGIATPLIWLFNYIPNIQLYVGIGY